MTRRINMQLPIQPTARNGSSEPPGAGVGDLALHQDLRTADPSLEQSPNGLVGAVEAQIIPRLLMARQLDGHILSANGATESSSVGAVVEKTNGGGTAPWLSMGQADVDAFASLLITYDAYVARQFVESQLVRGFELVDLLLNLCAPAARRLGSMWQEDECSFCDVTIGLSSLEQVILHLSDPVDGLPAPAEDDRTILLSTVPGNQHVFGLLIVKELFRKAGWIVRTPRRPDEASLLQALASTHFTALGLSIAASDDLQVCDALVKACRSESRNAHLVVMVGGPGVGNPEAASSIVSADCIVDDGRDGLVQAERSLARMSLQRHVN